MEKNQFQHHYQRSNQQQQSTQRDYNSNYSNNQRNYQGSNRNNQEDYRSNNSYNNRGGGHNNLNRYQQRGGGYQSGGVPYQNRRQSRGPNDRNSQLAQKRRSSEFDSQENENKYKQQQQIHNNDNQFYQAYNVREGQFYHQHQHQHSHNKSFQQRYKDNYSEQTRSPINKQLVIQRRRNSYNAPNNNQNSRTSSVATNNSYLRKNATNYQSSVNATGGMDYENINYSQKEQRIVSGGPQLIRQTQSHRQQVYSPKSNVSMRQSSYHHHDGSISSQHRNERRQRQYNQRSRSLRSERDNQYYYSNNEGRSNNSYNQGSANTYKQKRQERRPSNSDSMKSRRTTKQNQYQYQHQYQAHDVSNRQESHVAEKQYQNRHHESLQQYNNQGARRSISHTQYKAQPYQGRRRQDSRDQRNNYKRNQEQNKNSRYYHNQQSTSSKSNISSAKSNTRYSNKTYSRRNTNYSDHDKNRHQNLNKNHRLDYYHKGHYQEDRYADKVKNYQHHPQYRNETKYYNDRDYKRQDISRSRNDSHNQRRRINYDNNRRNDSYVSRTKRSSQNYQRDVRHGYGNDRYLGKRRRDIRKDSRESQIRMKNKRYQKEQYKRTKKYSYSSSDRSRDEIASSSSDRSSGSSSGSINSRQRSNGDAGHFKYYIGQIVNNYQVESFLGDGTFGRALKCRNREDGKSYAMKVIRAVKRYNESAQIEAQILEDIKMKGGVEKNIVYLHESFMHVDEKKIEQMCLVFETLGPSLYDFIKANKYKGFVLSQIQSFARQSLQALEFLHSIHLTHTDLKPENILLKYGQSETIQNQDYFPIQVKKKKDIYGPQKCLSDTEESQVEEQDEKTKRSEREDDNVHRCGGWKKPVSDEVRIIDFGGATYSDEHHTEVINTRQYRAPEVILGCSNWDEKSDIWSMVCILAELYTGEMFFPTHENVEHLALMEKQCGPFPFWMANNSKSEFREIFDLKKQEDAVQLKGMRIKWPEKAKNSDSEDNWLDMKTLDEIILFEENKDHLHFRDLLRYMLQLDPKRRPSASDCLRHPFFQLAILDETVKLTSQSQPQNQLATNAKTDISSKSTEKTRGSTSQSSPQTNTISVKTPYSGGLYTHK